MRDENPIRTLGDYSKPSHKGYWNTIKLPAGNTWYLFDPTPSASNWLERLPVGSITTWEDLTTRFLAQFFPPGRTAKLRNDILMFQQHHGESLSEAWTHSKDLLQKVLHHGRGLKKLRPESLGKSLRTSPSTTMKVGMKQKNLSRRPENT
ncbi:zinc finger, CCHC-type containing protein [Tanacetum coccineum]